MSKSIFQYFLEGLADTARRQQIEASLSQEWYTVSEASRELKVNTETLRRWIRSGEVQVSKPSPRKTLIHKNELVRLLTRSQA